MNNKALETGYSLPSRRVTERDIHRQRRDEALMAELRALRAHEKELMREKADLLERQDLLAREFEHRLINSLQLITSLLSMQSRAASSVEAAAQLTIAARRVAAFGRVHRRLHLLDHEKSVDFKQYLQDLCGDLSGLLFQSGAVRAIVVTGADAKLPTGLGIPLGFIVTELITNSVKYAEGDIIVRLEACAAAHLLSVADDGPGLPAEFDPAGGGGLGMKIVRSLVEQIGGTLQIARGPFGRGTCIAVAFALPAQAEPRKEAPHPHLPSGPAGPGGDRLCPSARER
jgi:two-component sensor histidine kinase